MKSQGSIYVTVVVAALAGFFAYQWWFNPNRMIKQRLGEVASTLTAPAVEQDVARLARLARLRRYLTDGVHIRVGRAGPELSSRDEALAAVAGWKIPPGGWNVDFVDVDVRVNSDDTARAFATADMTTRDPQTGQQTLDSREVSFAFVKQESGWLISEAEMKDLPQAR